MARKLVFVAADTKRDLTELRDEYLENGWEIGHHGVFDEIIVDLSDFGDERRQLGLAGAFVAIKPS